MRNGRRFRGTAIVLLAAWLAAPLPAPAASDTYDWHEGAEGYETVLAKAKEEDRPFLLLFFADWCGYCKRLKQRYLEVSPFDDLAAEHLRVIVRPDEGEAERALARSYGVTGYPTFLVLFPGQEKPSRIGPFAKSGDLTVEEFTDELAEALGRSYYNRGITFWKEKDHRRSLPFFEAAVKVSPGYSWGHYGLGTALWRAGKAERDVGLMRQGEASLARALELKPDLENARKELALVQAALKERGDGK